MSQRVKSGGHQIGTPNRRTLEIEQRLIALGCDPIKGMALIALDVNNAPELRAKMFSELAQYVAPKRKALDLSSNDRDKTVIFNLGMPLKDDRQKKEGSLTSLELSALK